MFKPFIQTWHNYPSPQVARSIIGGDLFNFRLTMILLSFLQFDLSLSYK